MQNAMERLNGLVMERGSLLAGLDLDIGKVLSMYSQMDEKYKEETGKPNEKDFEEYNDYLEAVMYDFCCDYIDAVKDTVVAIKIDIAFFESGGIEDLFFEVAEAAKEANLFVIADVNRANTENASRQYAEAYLSEDLPIDAVTINPYLGTEGVMPFLEIAKENGKGVFVLVKTSSSSSADIQDLELKDGRKVYHKVAELVAKWGKYIRTTEDKRYTFVGAIVDGAHPEDTVDLRRIMPNTFFLVSEYGEQGVTAEDLVVNFDDDEGGAIVNSSRGLMFAYERDGKIEKWKEATRKAAKRMQYELIHDMW